MRRVSPASQPKARVTTPMLEWIAERIDYSRAQHRLIFGATVLGFYFLLRSSEFLYVKGGCHQYVLQIRDVQIQDDNGVMVSHVADANAVQVQFRGSKTDQCSRGIIRALRRSGHRSVCPVLAAVILIENAKRVGLQPTDPICSLSRSCVLRANEVAKLIKFAVAALGNEVSRYSCHSLRSRGATALLVSNVDSTTIKLHGRWSSDMYQRYIRYSAEVGSTLAARLRLRFLRSHADTNRYVTEIQAPVLIIVDYIPLPHLCLMNINSMVSQPVIPAIRPT